jgi:hypothetical protein
MFCIMMLGVVRAKVGWLVLTRNSALEVMKHRLLESDRLAASLALATTAPVGMCFAALSLGGVTAPSWMLLEAQEGDICHGFMTHP